MEDDEEDEFDDMDAVRPNPFCLKWAAVDVT